MSSNYNSVDNSGMQHQVRRTANNDELDQFPRSINNTYHKQVDEAGSGTVVHTGGIGQCHAVVGCTSAASYACRTCGTLVCEAHSSGAILSFVPRRWCNSCYMRLTVISCVVIVISLATIVILATRSSSSSSSSNPAYISPYPSFDCSNRYPGTANASPQECVQAYGANTNFDRSQCNCQCSPGYLLKDVPNTSGIPAYQRSICLPSNCTLVTDSLCANALSNSHAVTSSTSRHQDTNTCYCQCNSGYTLGLLGMCSKSRWILYFSGVRCWSNITIPDASVNDILFHTVDNK